MPTAQYDYFAHYEDLWDARSMTSTPSTVEIPLADLPDAPEDEGEVVSPFDDRYEVPEPVLVLQDVPHEEREEIARERRERFVEAEGAEYTLVRRSSRLSETRCDSATSTLVDGDDDSATSLPPDSSKDPFADTTFPSSTHSDEDEDDISLTDTARLGHLHLTTKDSCSGLRRLFTPQQERKGGKARKVGRVVRKVLGGMVKGLGRVKSI